MNFNACSGNDATVQAAPAVTNGSGSVVQWALDPVATPASLLEPSPPVKDRSGVSHTAQGQQGLLEDQPHHEQPQDVQHTQHVQHAQHERHPGQQGHGGGGGQGGQGGLLPLLMLNDDGVPGHQDAAQVHILSLTAVQCVPT